MKLVLIDDEPLQLIGLQSVLDWPALGFTIVGTARTGEAGLELIRRERPDIAVCDIIMPRMDGLEMIRLAREEGLRTRFVLVSCMDDRSYYRAAIRAGVSEYLQKDQITAPILAEAVTRVADEIRRTQAPEAGRPVGTGIDEHAFREHFLRMAFAGGVEEAAGQQRLADWGMRPPYRAISAVLRPIDPDDVPDAKRAFRALALCREMLGGETPGELMREEGDCLSGLVCVRDESLLRRLCERMARTVEQCLDCRLVMGASRGVERVSELSAAKREAHGALEKSWFGGKDVLFTPTMADPEVAGRVQKQCEALLDAVGSDAESQRSALTSLAGFLSEGTLEPKKARRMMTSFLHRCLLCAEGRRVLPATSESALEACETAATLDEAVAAANGLLEAMDGVRRGFGDATAPVERIRQAVRAHLEEKLTLETIASEVYMSPSYVCRLFKRETGENLTDYIHREKVQRAVELLRTHTVGETAALLGYRSDSHFIAVFREQKGITPLKYRQELERGNQK